MRATLGRIQAMALKEVMHILRDPHVLVFALIMPVFLLLLFGYAVSFDVEHVPLAVVDADGTPASRDLVSRFTSSDAFELVATRDRVDEVEPLLRTNVARVALVIPHGFGRAIARGDEAVAQLLLDGSDNSTASVALGYANTIALGASQETLIERLGALSLPLEARIRTFFNPRLESAVFLVPGLMVILLVMVAVTLTALTVAREYESGSMEQLFATPVGRLEIILGKLGPYYVLGMTVVLIVLVSGVLLFDVPIAGELWLVFVITSVFILGMLTQGLVISVVTRNQMIASQVAAFSTMLPAMLLSGFIFPIDNMPLPLQIVARILPATYLVHGLRAVLLRGNGIAVVTTDLLALAGFFLVMLMIAVRRFQRSLT